MDFFSDWLQRYLAQENTNSIQDILNEHFNEKDASMLFSDLGNDVEILCAVFPDCKREDIIFILSTIGNEDNRLRIATRYLLKTKCISPLKRNGDSIAHQVDRKRSRLSDNMQILTGSKEVAGNPDNLHNKPTEPLSTLEKIELREPKIKSETVTGKYLSPSTLQNVGNSYANGVQFFYELEKGAASTDAQVSGLKNMPSDENPGVKADSYNADCSNELFNFSAGVDNVVVDTNNIQDLNNAKFYPQPNYSPKIDESRGSNGENSNASDNGFMLDFYNQNIVFPLVECEKLVETNLNELPIDSFDENNMKRENQLDTNITSASAARNEVVVDGYSRIFDGPRIKNEKPIAEQPLEHNNVNELQSKKLLQSKNNSVTVASKILADCYGEAPKIMENVLDRKPEDSGSNILLSIINNETVSSTIQLNEVKPVTYRSTNNQSAGSVCEIVHKPVESTIANATTVGSNFVQPSSYSTTHGKSCVVVPSASTLTTKCNSVLDACNLTSDNEMDNIYTKLKEMFPNIPFKHIEAVCNTHITGHIHVNNVILDDIVSKLLDFDHGGAQKIKEEKVEDVSYVSTTVPDDHVFHLPLRQFLSPEDGPDRSNTLSTALDRFFAHLEGENRGIEEVQEIIEDEDAAENTVLVENTAPEENNALVYSLMEVFPEACPQYLRKLCKGRSNQTGVLDDLITHILKVDYPKRQKIESPEHTMNADEQLTFLKELLPDADPTHLEIHCNRLIDKPDELKAFIAEAVETRNYPTKKDYLRRQQISAQQRQYTTEFTVTKFLEVIPDPETFFNDTNNVKVAFEFQHYVLAFLRNHFDMTSLTKIRQVFKKNQYNFVLTYKELQKVPATLLMKRKRVQSPMPEVIQNIPLMQQIAYIQHKDEIEKYLEQKKLIEQEQFNNAKDAGLLQTCSCCYDDEVMPTNIYSCDAGCIFCKECVRRGCEVAFGDGKLDFKCLNNCPSRFSLQTLQCVLIPKMFSKIAQKKQLEEVKAAGIEDLEMCPFCDFATIPPKEDKLFRCLNPDCMKESCRLCKEPSHVPLRCDELEKENDVKMRTFIENKMTEALLRTCYKCGNKFIKSDGCNKMTCTCGATMCYVCKQPVKDYRHFNGNGGDRHDLCPLFSDTNQLHQQQVLQGAQDAQREIGVDNVSKLKIDPTSDIQDYFSKNAKPATGFFNFNPFGLMNPAARDQQQRILERLEQLHNMRQERDALRREQLQRQRRHHRH